MNISNGEEGKYGRKITTSVQLETFNLLFYLKCSEFDDRREGKEGGRREGEKKS